MIVIHIDNNTIDTKILSRIYEKLNNITLLHNEKKSSIKRFLRFTETVARMPPFPLGEGMNCFLFTLLLLIFILFITYIRKSIICVSGGL